MKAILTVALDGSSAIGNAFEPRGEFGEIVLRLQIAILRAGFKHGEQLPPIKGLDGDVVGELRIVEDESVNGDAERIACSRAGELGHQQCGVCEAHRVPRFECGCLARLPAQVEHQCSCVGQPADVNAEMLSALIKVRKYFDAKFDAREINHFPTCYERVEEAIARAEQAQKGGR